MPILTKKLIHNFHSNRKTKENMEKFNLIYPFATDVEISVLDLKLIAPARADVHIECECNSCGRKFTKTLLRTSLENIKNDYVICNVCRRSITNQERFGRNYVFYMTPEERAKKAIKVEPVKVEPVKEEPVKEEPIEEKTTNKKVVSKKRKDS